MAGNPSKSQFLEEVFPAELEEIRRRRAVAGIDASELEGPPSPEMGLVGLALSGGGIRSATFSLGVIEALEKHGLLRHVDYMSTVSGGGFTGACLSSVLNDPSVGTDGERFPFRHRAGVEEPVSFRHLRNGSNFLVPGGFLHAIRLPALFLQGIVLNLLLILPVIMIGVMLTELVYELGHYWDVDFKKIPLIACALFLLMILAFPFLARAFRKRVKWLYRDRYMTLMAIAMTLALALTAILPVGLLIAEAGRVNWATFKELVVAELQHPFEAGDTWKWFLILVGLAAFLLAGKASQHAARWMGKLLLYVLGLLGPALIFLIYLLLCVFQIDSPYIDAGYRDELDRRRFSAELREVLASRGLNLTQDARVEVDEEGQRWRLIDGEDEHAVTVSGRSLRVATLDLWDGQTDLIFFGAWIVMCAFNIMLIDVNITSFHNYYRDRLSWLFLFRIGPEGKTEPNDGQKLADLGQPGTSAPYHLINATLNVHGSKDDSLRGRNADFFVLSKRFCGSERTGYCQTRLMEMVDSHLNLGTAMAISGAAAAPNMGAIAIRPLAFSMTLLNIRLGYWLPNPAVVRERAARNMHFVLGPGASYLLREALSRLDVRGRLVNVSDGGHLENLGIYELLRRRCKLIIAVDGAADPSHHFTNLVELMRFARIDIGIHIEFDLSDLENPEDGVCRKHWAMGTIHYGEGEVGRLLYLKASLTGDESKDVLAYRRHTRSFPHESTANQFFNEAQFEAYRALGYHAANRALLEQDEALVASPDIPSRADIQRNEQGADDAGEPA